MKKFLSFVVFVLCTYTSYAQERPVIGISDVCKEGACSVPRSYVDAVLAVDGIPIAVPLMQDDNKIIELLKSLDGIIFTGGEDFDPEYYSEQPIPQMGKINAPRDTFDIKLLRLAVEHGVPVLGICRGAQLINVAFGGSLYQDLPTQFPNKMIQHRQTEPKSIATHVVIVQDSTLLYDIVGTKMLNVNSFHHQAVKRVADGFRISGYAPDGVIESIEKVDSANWILGVQFHPEGLVPNDTVLLKIFQRFMDETCRLKR